MSTNLLGAVAAIGASTLFSVGLALQALETRGVSGDHSLRLSLFGQLVRRRRWVVGTLLTFLGFPLHALALLLAPLTVVQPALATGLLLLLVVGARMPGEHVGRREVIAVVGIVAGMIGITAAAPERGSFDGTSRASALALGGLAALSAAGYAFARGHHRRGGQIGVVTAFGAGIAYALSGFTAKLLTDALDGGAWLGAAGWFAATALVNAFGFLSQSTALQHRPATQVGPIVFAIPVVVPVVLAPLLVGESWRSTPGGGALLAAALALVGAGVAALGSSSSLSAFMASREPRSSS